MLWEFLSFVPRSVTTDTRALSGQDAVFFCLSENPERQDQQIREALENHARAVFAKKTSGSSAHQDERVTYLEHAQFQTLQWKVASYFFKNPSQNLKLYGVTGTNGKTTTTWFLYQLLNTEKPSGFIGTTGVFLHSKQEKTPWTTPESLVLQEIFSRARDQGLTSIAMEVSSHGVEEERIGGCIFQGLAFTNLTQDHLDYHKTFENYFQAKKKLFTHFSDEHSECVIFTGSTYGKKLALELKALGKHVIEVSFSKKAPQENQIHVHILESSLQGTVFQYWKAGHEIQTYRVGFFGDYNIANLALALSLSPAKDTSTLTLPPGRLERIKIQRSPYVFVDYAHTPDALENACRALATQKTKKQTLTVVFGCGGDRDAGKRPLMGTVAATWADRVILTTDNSRSEDPEKIISEIRRGIPESFPQKALVIEPDRRRALEQAVSELSQDGVLLVAGKGHEQTQTDSAGVHPFSDQEELRKVGLRV